MRCELFAGIDHLYHDRCSRYPISCEWKALVARTLTKFRFVGAF